MHYSFTASQVDQFKKETVQRLCYEVGNQLVRALLMQGPVGVNIVLTEPPAHDGDCCSSVVIEATFAAIETVVDDYVKARAYSKKPPATDYWSAKTAQATIVTTDTPWENSTQSPSSPTTSTTTPETNASKAITSGRLLSPPQ